MRNLAILTALAFASPAFADHIHHFRAHLLGFREVPSVNSKAEGVFEADLNADGASFNYTLTYQGLQANVTQAHLHFAQRRVSGPIIIWLCGSATNPGPTGTQTCPQSGMISGTISAADVLASPPSQQLGAGNIADFITAMRAGVTYANVHTSASPAGEIRGQVFPVFR